MYLPFLRLPGKEGLKSKPSLTGYTLRRGSSCPESSPWPQAILKENAPISTIEMIQTLIGSGFKIQDASKKCPRNLDALL